MTDDNSNPMRAVFLAALMVLWVFAGTVAFAGGAAALDGGSIDNGQVTPQKDTTKTDNVEYNTSFDFQPEVDGQNESGGMALVLTDAGGTTGGSVNSSITESDVTIKHEGTTVGVDGVFTDDVDGDGADDSIFVDFNGSVAPNSGDTLTANFSNAVNNPAVEGTYEAELRSYEGDNPFSGNFVSTTANYQISESGGDETQQRQPDQTFEGGSTRWKGQILHFQASPSACNASEYQLRYRDTEDADGYGTLIREITLNSSDAAQIPTRNVADNEEVVITAIDGNTTGTPRRIVELNGTSTQQSPACFDTGNGSNDFVEVIPQTLTANFSDDSVPSGDNSTLEVDSNRNNYDLYIASDDFSSTELAGIFADDGATTSGVNSERAPNKDGVVRVNGVASDAELEANFGGVATGNYSFTLSPTDTTPSDTAGIEITEEVAGQGQFASETGAFSVKRGDIQSDEGHDDATISVDNVRDTDFIVIRIGNEDRNNYETTVVVEVDDGEADIRMNTFLAGQVDAGNESKAFRAVTGEIVSVNRQSPKITGVLDEGQYDLALETTDGDQVDAGVLNIRESSYNELSQQRHPDASLNSLDEKSELTGNEDLTDTNLVTLDRDSGQRDILVHTIDISGIYGALSAVATEKLGADSLADANGNDVLAESQNGSIEVGSASDEILNVSLTQTNFKQNREPKVAEYDNPSDADDFRFVIDEDNETLYLVTDPRDIELNRSTGTGVEQTQIESGDDFDFQFGVGPGFEDAYAGGIDTYVPSGGDMTHLVTEDREAEFEEVGADRVRVNNEANQTIAAETNVAPGTQVTIQVSSTSRTRRANDTETGDTVPVFQRATTTVVAGDSPRANTFSDDSFDFSENEVGRQFTVTSPGTGYDNDAQKPGVVVEGTPASVALSDITVPADQDELATITVDSVYMPQGGFVTIHDGTLADGAVFDSVRGTSGYLEADTEHSNVEVSLDTPYTESGTAIAMPHQDTNDNEEYDFVTSEGEEDVFYEDPAAEGQPLTAQASVTFETPTPTPTASPTPTDEPDEPTATPTETEDQPGFGAALALIALIGAALLAARRRDF